MLPYTNNMRQTATYWPPGNNDGYGGITYSAPRSILTRWQDVAELFRDPEGNEVSSSAVVYVASPVSIKGYLYLGISIATDPQLVDGAREIRQAAISPDLTQTRALHKVWL